MTNDDKNTQFRSLPSVEQLLQEPGLGGLAGAYSHAAVVSLARQQLDATRRSIRNGGDAPGMEQLAADIMARAEEEWAPWPRPLVNATGVVIHTNLGRAPLSEPAMEAVQAGASGYSDLEFDVKTGTRGSRQAHIGRLIAEVTGAETGLVVNNNASAIMLGLSAVAGPGGPREVIVSRGEGVEIGGGFRVPDVLRQSGATLVEVGTTNRTYVRDYASAINDNTAAILKVHPSNFRVTGFTHEAELGELMTLGRERGVPVLNDLGSGCLLDTTHYGLAPEPTVQDSVDAGVELSFFSGDKLIGGPQAGIVAGSAEWVERLARHPLARAVRIDKMGLAALSATLASFLKERAHEEVPVWCMISMSQEAIAATAESWLKEIESPAVRLREGQSTVGGGSLPGETLPTTLLTVTPPDSPDAFAGRLRSGPTPVIARIEDEDVVLDPRTVLEDQSSIVVEAVKSALKG
ncbi:MAG TPA: L-seryl-tRNA(Sec) selenium transferase [Dehalococcoidia bacterium]|nr:L-seryl-tRNA(Sec) selenium transferase [Chloroflexota bacterium]MDP5877125.1 L-seryl-tRNA(Sec) selenium transferase [Dehalococcoidia bacterium]MDP7161685.1 L-seryl-tRNA(Sec) selenium transferase [Dehalococcoidia bacterium]MDP7213968.1 L-seryl-tRNA(Sec) selenium transferase [Dehalococcoidia bacterium]MDP7514436.1 L-seryl-tRNA(Sec) selenium transferase [Dehalococcoidia bacterium]